MKTTENNPVLPELTDDLRAGIKFDLHSANITYYFILSVGVLIAAVTFLTSINTGIYELQKWAFYSIFAVVSIILGLLIWRFMINRFERKTIVRNFLKEDPTLSFLEKISTGIQVHVKSTKLNLVKLIRLFTAFYGILSLNLAVFTLSDLSNQTADDSVNIDYVYFQVMLAGISLLISALFVFILAKKYKKILA